MKSVSPGSRETFTLIGIDFLPLNLINYCFVIMKLKGSVMPEY